MKKGVVILSLLLVLSISIVSAGWFSDFYNKVTGNVVSSTCPIGLTAYYNGENSEEIRGRKSSFFTRKCDFCGWETWKSI